MIKILTKLQRSKWLILYLFTILVFDSCKTNDIVRNDISNHNPDILNYQENSFDYELYHNSIKMNKQQLEVILKNDSANLIESTIKNMTIETIEVLPLLKIVQLWKSDFVDFQFYKIYRSMHGAKYLYEYEYPISYSGRLKTKVILIEPLPVRHNPKGAYIKWSSKPVYNEDLYVDYNENHSIYMWGINKTTDTLTTNLSLKTIQILYPEFSGIYIFKKYKKIIVDYQYVMQGNEFFKKIEFIE